MGDLNKKQLLFIDKYMTNGKNGTNAYIEVYKPKNTSIANGSASRLLANVKVKEEIARREQEELKRYNIKREQIIKELLSILESDYMDYFKFNIEIIKDLDEDGNIYEKERISKRLKLPEELTLEQRRAIKSIKTNKFGEQELELYDKQFSINQLNQMFGYLEQNINIDTKVDTSILKDFTKEELLKIAFNDD